MSKIPAYVPIVMKGEEAYVLTEKALAVPEFRRMIIANLKRQVDKAKREYDAMVKFAETITVNPER